MKRIFFLLCFIYSIIFCDAQGPGFLWAKNMGGSGFTVGVEITYDASGNVYTGGYFSGNIDFDPGPGTFTIASFPGLNNDIFISKLDASGNFVWAKGFGGSSTEYGCSIKVDAVGNVFAMGSFSGTVDFDPGPGTFSITSNGQDIFILKLDAAGNFVWATNIGGPSNDGYTRLDLDASGNVYTTGVFGGTVDFDPGPGTFSLSSTGLGDIFILKLDNSGNFVWVKGFGGSFSESPNSLSVDFSGNIYCAGSFSNTVDFDPGPGTFTLSSLLNQTGFILKLDVSGNFVWAKNSGGFISIDALGNVYSTGVFSGTQDFDPGLSVFNLTSVGPGNTFVLKLDAVGNFIWAKNFGGSGASIDIDALGNVYTIGSFAGTVDFDPGVATFNLTSFGGSNDVFLSKLDASGNFIWAGALTGNSTNDQGASITLDSFGNLYATGFFHGIIDFDPDAGVFNINSSTSTDAFVLKMAACCAGIHELSKNDNRVLVYPNPSNGVFNLNIEDEIGNADLVLFNTLGQIVFEQKIIKGINQINTNGIAKGLYNCKLISKQQKIGIGKLAIQ